MLAINFVAIFIYKVDEFDGVFFSKGCLKAYVNHLKLNLLWFLFVCLKEKGLINIFTYDLTYFVSPACFQPIIKSNTNLYFLPRYFREYLHIGIQKTLKATCSQYNLIQVHTMIMQEDIRKLKLLLHAAAVNFFLINYLQALKQNALCIISFKCTS